MERVNVFSKWRYFQFKIRLQRTVDDATLHASSKQLFHWIVSEMLIYRNVKLLEYKDAICNAGERMGALESIHGYLAILVIL